MNKLKKITIIIDGKHADHGYWTGEQIEGCSANLGEPIYEIFEAAIKAADNDANRIEIKVPHIEGRSRRSHTLPEIAMAMTAGQSVYVLDTGLDGEDDVLFDDSEEPVIFDILAYHEIDEMPDHWTINEVTDFTMCEVTFEDRNQCFYDQCSANEDINEDEPIIRRYVAGASTVPGWKHFCIECAEQFDEEAASRLSEGSKEYYEWNGGHSHLTGSELTDPDDETYEAQQLIDGHGFGMESLGPVECITVEIAIFGLRIYDDQESAITTLREIERACEAVDHGDVEAFWQHFLDI
jgi:hypothetical protein